MKTDTILKRITRLCASDLLPWLGMPDALVLEVTTPEIQATVRRLDSLLTLQTPAGATSLHLIEWQGYRDEQLLWRVLEYVGMLGQSQNLRPIRVTIIYLKPGDDVGNQLDQAAQTVGGWQVQFHVIRLWEHTAQEALASGRPGLLALLPLLAGATSELVVQSAQTILDTVAPQAQSELLAALGALADQLIPVERFLRLVTKERLMETDLISYLLKDKELAFAEREAALLQEKASLEERLAVQAQATLEERLAAEATQREATLRTSLQQAVEDAIIARFPLAPAALTRRIRAISDPARLQALIPAVITAPDLVAVETLLA